MDDPNDELNDTTSCLTPRSNNTRGNDDEFSLNSRLTPRSSNTRLQSIGFNDDDFLSNPHPTPRSNTRFHNDDILRSSMFHQTSAESNQSTLPAAFSDMTSVHQICLWLCDHSSILLLAYNMFQSIHAPITNTFHFTSNFNQPMLTTGVPKQEVKQEVGVCITIIDFIN